MLLSLSIRDFVLIEKLDLTFAHGADSGLGALTGETGAGKSILIDALGLALGARADSAAVRRGASQASVAASFDLPKAHAAHALKGSCGNVGAMRMVEICQAMETLGHTGSVAGAAALGIKLREEFDHVRRALEEEKR